MRKLGGIVLASAVVGLTAMGCSSSSSGSSSDPFGGTPDFAAIQTEFDKPSGSLQGNESAAFNSYSDQTASSSSGAFPDIGGGSTSAQSVTTNSLHTLGGGLVSPECADLQNGKQAGSCSCPGGGSLNYDISGIADLQNQQQSGKIDVTIKYAADLCRSSDGQDSFDGRMFIHYGTASTAAAQSGQYTLIYDAHFTVVAAGKSATVDATYAQVNGKIKYSVKVSDGNVVISGSWDKTTKSGTLEITDKNDTWTCVINSGKGKCTSATGGSRDVSL